MADHPPARRQPRPSHPSHPPSAPPRPSSYSSLQQALVPPHARDSPARRPAPQPRDAQPPRAPPAMASDGRYLFHGPPDVHAPYAYQGYPPYADPGPFPPSSSRAPPPAPAPHPHPQHPPPAAPVAPAAPAPAPPRAGTSASHPPAPYGSAPPQQQQQQQQGYPTPGYPPPPYGVPPQGAAQWGPPAAPAPPAPESWPPYAPPFATAAAAAPGVPHPPHPPHLHPAHPHAAHEAHAQHADAPPPPHHPEPRREERERAPAEHAPPRARRSSRAEGQHEAAGASAPAGTLDYSKLIESYRAILESTNALAMHPRGDAAAESLEQMVQAAAYGHAALDAEVQRRAADAARAAAPAEEGDGAPARTRQVSISRGEPAAEGGQTCLGCNATSTPEWRRGPLGPRTLCNACGLVYAKLIKKRNREPGRARGSAQARPPNPDALSSGDDGSDNESNASQERRSDPGDAARR